jgi:type I restriction enzyme S subunit
MNFLEIITKGQAHMNEGPYELPAGWRWVRLEEVCLINPRRPNLELKPSTPTTFVPMAAVDDKLGQIVSPEVKPFVQVKKGYTYFIDGDVLFAKITPCMENGKSAIARKLVNGFGFGSTEFHILRPSSALISEWIWFFVRRAEFRKAARNEFRGGVGQQRVPAEFLRETFVPLPPLEEQRRIVARIEELMERVREARRLRQNALEDTDRLWQSVLSETFPRPGTELPAGWRWVRLGEVTTFIKSGFAFSKKNGIKGDVLHLRPYNIGDDGQIKLEQQFFIPKSMLSADWSPLEPGDVLFNNTNSVELVGKTALVKSELHAAYSNHLTRICVKRNMCEGGWLALVLNVLWHKGFFAKQCNKWIGQAGFNTEALGKLLIPLPLIEEQRQIVDYLESVQEKIKAIKKAQERTEGDLRLLEQSILDRAFRGEL